MKPLFFIFVFMCVVPWTFVFKPLGVPMQMIGLAIQSVGFCGLIYFLWRMLKKDKYIDN